MKMRSYYLGELTWPDVKEFLAVHGVAVVPVGSCEQHGPHGFSRNNNSQSALSGTTSLRGGFIETSYDAHAGEFETSTTLANRENFVVKERSELPLAIARGFKAQIGCFHPT